MKYEIRATASLGSEWSVTDEGKFDYLLMESDCHQLDGYFIVAIDENEDEETIFESNDFATVKEKLATLNK